MILALLVANVPAPFRADELENTMVSPDDPGMTEASEGTENETGTEASSESETEGETETEAGTETETETEMETETETETEAGKPGAADYDTRTITVIDNRADTEKKGKTTASVPKTYAKTVFLRIESSEGKQIKPQINEKYGYDGISPFTMILATEDTGGAVVSDFGERCTVTMVPPDDYAASKKEIRLYGVEPDGSLEEIYTVEAKTTSGETYLMFSTDHMGEYAFVLNEKEKMDIETQDERDDKVGTVSSQIIWDTAEVAGTTLVIEDNEGTDDKNTDMIPLLEETEEYPNAQQMGFYDLSLVDGEEQEIGSDSSYRVYVHLPLPREMKLDRGEIAAVYTYTLQADGTKKAEKAEIVDTGTEGGIPYVDFIATHFTEYTVLYGEITEAANEGASAEGQNAQNQPPQPQSTAAESQTVVATVPASTENTTEAAQPQNGQNSTPARPASTENTASPANGANPQNTAAAQPASTENAASTARPASTEATNTQTTANAQGSSSENRGKVDMPKTADATTYRNILVILFLAAGCFLLVTCIPVRRKKREQK